MSFQGLKALIVDDDTTTQNIIIANLNASGIEAVSANNGTEAIEALEKQDFDFVLMDIRMPSQDGLDSARWIRQMKNSTAQIPIFALTMYSSQLHTDEILNAGMDEHLIKPFRMEKLRDILGKYF